MPLATVITLLAQYGLPLTQQIFTWVNSGKTTVTSEDWEQLVKLGQYRSTDALTAAGIKIVDGKVVPV
jgi:hypothetical protein